MNYTSTAPAGSIEKSFLALAPNERATIIRRGVALGLSDLKKRLFLAESKARFFEGKYCTSLAQLDRQGLPDDAGVELHEDYLMWHHWAEALETVKQEIASLEEIAQQASGWWTPAMQASERLLEGESDSVSLVAYRSAFIVQNSSCFQD